MAKVRDERVGKRFLSVSKSCKLKLNKICEWDWRAGVIRACTHADSKHPELQILVEYEDVSWQRREWIHVHKEQAFQVLLVEHTLVWAPRNGDSKLRGLGGLYPALEFEPLVDEVGLSQTKEAPIEFLTDRKLEFHDYAYLRTYQDGECLRLGDEQSQEAVRQWVAEQDGQRILCTTPSVLVGFRVQVYRSEGTTQWYTAVIVGYNDTTRELTVTDDTVLEEHCEDPSLVHIRLLGEGVVESILRGENVGITPRRSRSSSNQQHQQLGTRHHRRDHQIVSSRGRKNALPSTKVATPSISPLQGLSPLSPAGSVSPITPHSLNPLKPQLEDQPVGQEALPSNAPPRCFDSCLPLTPLKSGCNSPSPGQEEKKKANIHRSQVDSDSGKARASHSPLAVNPQPQQTSSITSAPNNSHKPPNLKQQQNTESDGVVAALPTTSPARTSQEKLSKNSNFETQSDQKEPDGSSTDPLSTSQSSSKEPSKQELVSVLGNSEKEHSFSSSNACSVSGNLKKVIIKLRNNIRIKTEASFEDRKAVSETEAHQKEQQPSTKLQQTPADSVAQSVTDSLELKNPTSDCLLTSVATDPCDTKVNCTLYFSKLSSDTKRDTKSLKEQNSEVVLKSTSASSEIVLKSVSSSESSEEKSFPAQLTSQTNREPKEKEDIEENNERKGKLEDQNSADASQTEAKKSSCVRLLNETDQEGTGRGSDSVEVKGHLPPSNGWLVQPIPVLLTASAPDALITPKSPVVSSVKSRADEERTGSCEPLEVFNCSSPHIGVSFVPSSSSSGLDRNAEVGSRRLNTDCTVSLLPSTERLLPDGLSILTVTTTHIATSATTTDHHSPHARDFRVSGSPPLSKGPTVGSPLSGGGGGGGLTHSLAAAGAVSGRAVTITATSGPAPQGNSRVASPPSVSITAVVRSPPYPHHHHLGPEAPPHHDGVAVPLHLHPHPQPPQPPFGTSLATGTRMDQGDGSSDSGVSVTERSVSRSSVLSDDRSSSAEVKPNTPTPTPVAVPLPKLNLPPLIVDRKEAVKVWRNPAVLSQSELSIRHIHSLQHSSAMSQHFPGVPPHIAAAGGTQTGAPTHPSTHGPPPPPASSLSHAIAAPLHYPSTHAPPPHLHMTPGLQPSLSAAAALYPQLQQDVWKQLGHVGGLAPHAYASLLPRHQEELSYLEHHQAGMIERERREAEAREKQKEKMERERVEKQRKERERRERDERERVRRSDWGGESDLQLVNKHFEDSFRYASQKFGRENLRQLPSDSHPASVYYAQPNQQIAPHLTHNQSLLLSQQPHQQPSHQQSQPQQNQNKIYQPLLQANPWSQTLGSLTLKTDTRTQPPRHSQGSEAMRKVKEPEQLVQESIFKAFRDDPIVDPNTKAHNPPPAHSKHSADKSSSSSISGYPVVHFGMKEHKHHPAERSTFMPHEKASVIVQPDLKYEKVAQHPSVSPKQRHPERSSPYASNPGSLNNYKPYEPSPTHRVSSTQHPTTSSSSPIPHTVELTKGRQQPLSSPHASAAAVPDRYYSPGTKTSPVTNPYQSSLVTVHNHLHSINAAPSKAKVSSPPPKMYGKPGITSGTPVCKIDTRPSPQPLPLTSKVSPLNGPPPAHSGNRSQDSRPPPTPHEQRVSHNRSPFDASRHYSSGSGASHPKTVTTSVASTHSTSRLPAASPHTTGHHPTQTQPLDLGTRDCGGGSSPTNRRRSQTPTPQESKRPRLDGAAASPLLSRVSEPSPLYPSAATTITTVENTVALASLQRVSSPAGSSPQSALATCNSGKSSSVITNAPNPFNPSQTPPDTQTLASNTTSRPSSSQAPNSPSASSNRMDKSSSGISKQIEPEKCSSPGPSTGGYVHKLKKAWMQRLKSGAEAPSTSGTASRGATPPPTISTTASTKSLMPLNSSSMKQEGKVTPTQKAKPLIVGLPNGHGQESKEADSTSTDSEDEKLKRAKAKRNLKRTKKSSESESDKESDGSEGSTKKSENMPSKQDAEPRRRRGRKPKSKQEKEEGFKGKKPKEEPPNDPLHKPPVSQLKKTGESFLQDRSCYEVAPKLPKCRECRWTAHQRNKKMPNIFCRFYAFRRLRYTKNGQLAVAGFSDPVKDAFGEDLRLWVPDPSAPAPDLDCEMSKFLITHVGDQFCDLVQQEEKAMALHMGEDSVVAWKRVVQGVREMCDVCETTLFNIHWACSKCGFVVCIDCYKGRKEGTIKLWDTEEGAKERDKFSWLLCASRVPHEQDKLMLTQIIAGNALVELGNKIHEIRYKWGIPMYCGCPEANKYKEKEQEDKKLNGINKDLIKNMKKEPKCDLVNGSVKIEKGDRINGKDDDMSNSPLNFFADVALSNDKRESESSNSDSDSDSDDKETRPSTLRELLTVRPSSKSGPGGKEENTNTKTKEPSKKKAKLDTLDDVISCVIERGVDKDNKKDPMKVELKHFIRKYNYNRKGREPLPIRIMTKTESRLLYPNVPHSWLCDGKLLRLHDPMHPDNVAVFQDQWKRGQPVIVSGSGQTLNADLWKPQSFSKDFGEVKNNLINCITENIVPNQPMKKFWDGFENFGKRLKDEKGQPMVLKLKDWPPTEDFAEMLPSRFEDLMKSLPMGQYTRRNGSLNLAGRLPECFVRPDLGPKMYIAYGSAAYPGKASTNLHLDISDAVNVMCYVGVTKDVEYEDGSRDTLKAIDEAGCDILTRQRVREKEEIPGALWHIYHSRDSDKIRDLLNKVAIERGKKLEPYHDPIHDQSWYLDGPLRERLYKEYAVEGYAIVQCMGDAVFIPAGAPHQVRNLQNCVKVAEDFVSPENVAHCFHLTQEFRHLSDTHTNHEDKLQIKNIIYHAMKDSIASLMASEQSMEEKVKTSDS